MKSRPWLVAVLVVMAVQMSPVLEKVSAQSGPGIVISELRFSGPRGDNDEFIELFNASDADISIGRWLVRVSGANSQLAATRFTIPDNTRVRAGCYFLMAFTRATATVAGYSGSVVADLTYTTGFGDLGGIAIGPTIDTLVDRVGFSTGTLYQEPLVPANTGFIDFGGFSLTNRSFERRPGGGAGHVDTNNNRLDFQVLMPSNPQNSASACVESSVKPHQVQGDGSASPMAGAVKTVKGVVTARAHDGFFIQTEVGEEDNNAGTSEGLFVFTGVGVTVPAAAQVGHLVSVNGTVQEFVPATDPGSAPRTQLRYIRMTDLGTAAMPDAYVLTVADLSDAGTLDQLERLEGMRVTAPSLTAVSGTAADGVFYAVLSEQFTNHGRPFREPGVEAGYPVLACASGECNVPLFDGNPERLRVDADALEGITAMDISTGAVLSDVTGPLDFGSRTYTLFPEAALAPGGMAIANLSPADESLYTVASFNATRFGDVVEAVWAAKAALALQSMGLPDVVALQGVDNAALDALVAQVSAVYAPVVVAGSDLAFLLKSRVSADSPVVVGTTDLFDRPSVLLRVTVNGPSTSLPQALAVLVNHLEPVNGVLATRQAQANFLADYVHGLQSNPNEAFVVVGDFNAFSFNDGYVDTVGTIRGLPAPANEVAFETFSAVSPALLDLGAPYSFVLNGNAQTHEHVLASANLASQVGGVARPRINGDFPDAWRHDDTTPARVSVKDPVVASFSFPPDVAAPVFDDPQPSNVTAEATGPNGAEVSFATPTATDNLDDVVVVTCSPQSGSLFAIGNSGVTCSAIDVAGNEAEDVGFTVTVHDTTAPVITVPDDITEEATSVEGRVVTYNTSASDAVSGLLAASCSPASGSMFPIGTTEVQCLASDAAGNVGEASFSVNISRPVPGRMRGAGTVGAGLQRVSFTFEAGESTNFVERGWLMVHIKDGAGRPRYVAGMVEDVSFSNADGDTPGQWPASGVDTVTFSGVGYWNGRAGYRFEVIASDRGEPGVNNDSFALRVTAPTGEVVESASGVLRAGNIQSLR